MYRINGYLSGNLSDLLREFLSGAINIDGLGKNTSWTWGLEELDRVLGPLQPGSLTVITGRPGSGKSTLLRHIALANAGERGKVVEFYPYESLKGQDQILLAAAAQGVSPNELFGVNSQLSREDVLNNKRVILPGEIQIIHGEPAHGSLDDLTCIDGAHMIGKDVASVLRSLRESARSGRRPIVATLGEQLISGDFETDLRVPFRDWEHCVDEIIELKQPRALELDGGSSVVEIWLLKSRLVPVPLKIAEVRSQFEIGRFGTSEEGAGPVAPPFWRDRLDEEKLLTREPPVGFEREPKTGEEELRKLITSSLADEISSDRAGKLSALVGSSVTGQAEVAMDVKVRGVTYFQKDPDVPWQNFKTEIVVRFAVIDTDQQFAETREGAVWGKSYPYAAEKALDSYNILELLHRVDRF